MKAALQFVRHLINRKIPPMSQAFKRVLINGSLYKPRSVSLVSSRLKQAQNLRRAIYNGPQKDWARKAKEAGLFWGRVDFFGENEPFGSNRHPAPYIDRPSLGPKDYTKNCNFKSIRIVEYKEDGYSTKGIGGSSFEEIVRITDGKDLPLMMIEWPQTLPFVELRFKEELLPIPYRQDLINEWHNLETRLQHIYHVIDRYQELLKYYITTRFHDQIYDKFSNETLIIITIGQETYHFHKGRAHGSLELFNDKIINYTVPEGETIKW